MFDDALSLSDPQRQRGAFLTTRWSMVVHAREEEHPEALAQLCRDYWYPLYAFLRRRGLPMEDAQDVTQGFFLHLLDGSLLDRASPEKGRFRSYLLGAMQNFLANERRRTATQKRGGGEAMISIDAAQAEERFALEPADQVTPERQFERSWTLALLDLVMNRLRAEYEKADRLPLYEALQPHLSGAEGRPGYARLGAALGMSESAVTVAMHRMRRRYGEFLREEIAQTVTSPEEVEEELRHLMHVVSNAAA